MCSRINQGNNEHCNVGHCLCSFIPPLFLRSISPLELWVGAGAGLLALTLLNTSMGIKIRTHNTVN